MLLGRKKTGTSVSHAVFEVLIGAAMQLVPLRAAAMLCFDENLIRCTGKCLVLKKDIRA